MKRHILIALFLLQSSATSKADTFTINGKEISVPSPEGFVRVTDEMSAVMRLTQQMDDPVNDTLAWYIPESDVPAAMDGEIPGMERTFVLKVNKELRDMTVGKDDFSQIKSMTKSQNQEMFEEVKSQIPEQMKNLSQGVSQEFNVDVAMEISQMVPLESHYEEENALAFSMFINFGVSAGNEKVEDVVAATSTILNASGTVLFLYGYAPKDELQWTRDASMNWAESVMKSNIQPPDKSPGNGIDWGKVKDKALVGAIIGGLFGLFAGLVSLIKRKKG